MDRVEAALKDTKLIAWDRTGIYLALDYVQARWYRDEPEYTVAHTDMMATIQTWWQQSGPERFIHGVRGATRWWEQDTYIQRVVVLVPRLYEPTPTVVKAKWQMYRCSLCTQAFCCDPIEKKCSRCSTGVPAVCDRCVTALVPDTCFQCTERAHICLSKCSGGCINKQKPTCCSVGPRRLQVKKEGNNKGRFFWSCEPCKFFQWD